MRKRERARTRAQLPAQAPSLAPPLGDLHSRAGNRAIAQAIAAVRAPGRPLENGVREEMERRLGVDLRAVRVHTGEQASRATDSLGAHAYTVGDHIVFRGDMYRPDGKAGRRMLAHELAHVVQQRAGIDATGLVARDHDSEGHADRVATRISTVPPERAR